MGLSAEDKISEYYKKEMLAYAHCVIFMRSWKRSTYCRWEARWCSKVVVILYSCSNKSLNADGRKRTMNNGWGVDDG